MFSKQSKTTQVRDIPVVNEKLWSNTKLIFQEHSLSTFHITLLIVKEHAIQDFILHAWL